MRAAKKGTVRAVLTAVLLAAFCAFMFAQPARGTKKFWFAFLCGLFAAAFQFYAIHTVYGKKTVKGRFYGFPVSRMSIYYLLLQLGASAAEVGSGMSGWWMAAINVPLLAFPVMGFLTTRTIQAEIARQDAKRSAAE